MAQEKERTGEQKVKYNNPFMDHCSSHPFSEMKGSKQHKFTPSKPEEKAGVAPPPPLSLPHDNVPQWQIDFPFVNQDHIDVEMRKELWKSIPKTSEWEKFSGELPYNHEL
jgi:hypothetical protein